MNWRKAATWRLAGAAALVLAAVVALGPSVGQSARAGGNQAAASIIVNGTTDSVTNLDPAGNYDFGSFTLDALIFEHLLDFKTGATLRPSLATRCVPVGTVKTWRCTLRRGVKFHDGSSFDSADVKWSFDRVLKIKDPSGISSLLGNLRSVTTNGPYSVIFHLKSPQSTWPFILATGAGFIVPKDVYPDTKLQPNTSPQIGTGPYRLVKYTPGQQAVFEKWDGYWGPKARNDQLIVRYFSKSSTMKLALERGEIDMAFQTFTPTELDSLKRAKGIRVYQGPGAVIRYLVFNVVREPTRNLAVRKAIAYLMPRQTIASRVYRGYVQPLYSMVPAGLPGHVDAFATIYGRKPNPAAARKVMREAGLQMPFPIEIWWTPTHYGDASADEYAEIKRALDASGVFKVTLKSAEWAQYSDALGNQYNAFQLGWFPDYPDAENYIVPFYRSDTFLANGYKNPRMDALIKRELAAKTPAERLRAIRQAQLLAAKDVPIVPYWQAKMIAVARDSIKGIPRTLDAAFIMRFWLLSKSS
ncbi:MAG: ABC transporter substrate-binding protein [Thermoleophilia bacterium]